MTRVVIFDMNDIGSDYRLLRHAKSFSKLQDSYVYLFGPIKTTLPEEIEFAPNIQIIEFPPFPNYNFYFAPLLGPVSFIYNLIAILIISLKLKRIDYVISTTTRLFSSVFYAYILKSIKKAKLILDVKPLKYQGMKHSKLQKIEYVLPCIADIRIVPSLTMQQYYSLTNIEVFAIKDEAGPLFVPRKSQKSDICSILTIDKNTNLVAIPFPFQDENHIRMLTEFLQLAETLETDITFIIFSGGKGRRAIDNHFSNVEFKNIKTKFFQFGTDFYPAVLGTADLGICFEGAPHNLDIAKELTEMEWCGLPVAVFLHGCVKETVTDNCGFTFHTKEDLVAIVKKCFVDRAVDLDAMSDNIRVPLVRWEDRWNEVFGKFLD